MGKRERRRRSGTFKNVKERLVEKMMKNYSFVLVAAASGDKSWVRCSSSSVAVTCRTRSSRSPASPRSSLPPRVSAVVSATVCNVAIKT